MEWSEEREDKSGGMPAQTREEFEAFYRDTAPALLRYIRRIAGNSSSAEDILQNAFIRLLNGPALQESGRKAYLYTTATNLIKDEWRKQARERHWWQLHPVTESYSTDPGLSADMARLMNTLKPRERALLWLAYGAGFDHREIASILHVSERSVRVMLHRVRNKARTLLTQAGSRLW
jgi:RNA polymerase sigma-70 factor (ECF subfamily)